MKNSLFRMLITASLSLLTANIAMAKDTIADLPAGVYELDKTHASLTWKVSHLGLSNYTARFTRFDASVKLDPKDVTRSTVMASIDPTSIETDYPYPEKTDFDKKLITGADWFNTEKFPKIGFRSTKITMNSDNTGTMTGDLTFLGVTKPVTLDVVLNGAMKSQPFSKKPALGFSANGTIKRSDWGFSTYVPNIGDEVELLLEVEFGKNK